MFFHQLAYFINLISSNNQLYSKFIVRNQLDKLILVNKGHSNTQFFLSTTNNYCDITNDLKWLLMLFCDRFLLLSKCTLNDDAIGNCIVQDKIYHCALKSFQNRNHKKKSTSSSLPMLIEDYDDTTENYFTREFFANQIPTSNIYDDFSENEWTDLVGLLDSEDESANLIVFYSFKDSFTKNYDLRRDDIIKRIDNSSFKEFLSNYFYVPKYDIYWNSELIEKIYRVSRLLARRKLSIAVDDLNYTHNKHLNTCRNALKQLKENNKISLKVYNKMVESSHPVPSQRTNSEIQNFKQKKDEIENNTTNIELIDGIKTMHQENIKNAVLLNFIIGYDMFNIKNDGLYIYIKGIFIKHIPLLTLLSTLDKINDPSREDLTLIFHRGFCAFINCNEDINIQTCNELNLKTDEFILRKHFKTIYLEFTKIKSNMIIYDDNILFKSKNVIGNIAFWKTIGYSPISEKLSNYDKSYEYRYFYTYNFVQCCSCKKWRELDLLSMLEKKDNERVLYTPDKVLSELKPLLETGIECKHPFVNIRR